MDNQMKKEAEAALAIAGGSIFGGKDAAPVKVEVRFLLTHSTRCVLVQHAYLCLCSHRLRQAPPRIEAVVPMAKGFMIVGGMGFIAVYERIDDKVCFLSPSSTWSTGAWLTILAHRDIVGSASRTSSRSASPWARRGCTSPRCSRRRTGRPS